MICRRSACRNVRLKWRSDSGPGAPDADVLVLLRDDPLLALGLDARAAAAPRPGSAASSSSDSSTSSACSPAWSPALPGPSAFGSPLPRLSPTSPCPCPTPPRSLLPKRKRGMLICGSGIETRSLPLRPISSPCEMYLRRSCLIFPRTMSRKRRWSGSIRRAADPSDHQVDEPSRLRDRRRPAAGPSPWPRPPAPARRARASAPPSAARCEKSPISLTSSAAAWPLTSTLTAGSASSVARVSASI